VAGHLWWGGGRCGPACAPPRGRTALEAEVLVLGGDRPGRGPTGRTARQRGPVRPTAMSARRSPTRGWRAAQGRLAEQVVGVIAPQRVEHEDGGGVSIHAGYFMVITWSKLLMSSARTLGTVDHPGSVRSSTGSLTTSTSCPPRSVRLGHALHSPFGAAPRRAPAGRRCRSSASTSATAVRSSWSAAAQVRLGRSDATVAPSSAAGRGPQSRSTASARQLVDDQAGAFVVDQFGQAAAVSTHHHRPALGHGLDRGEPVVVVGGATTHGARGRLGPGRGRSAPGEVHGGGNLSGTGPPWPVLHHRDASAVAKLVAGGEAVVQRSGPGLAASGALGGTAGRGGPRPPPVRCAWELVAADAQHRPDVGGRWLARLGADADARGRRRRRALAEVANGRPPPGEPARKAVTSARRCASSWRTSSPARRCASGSAANPARR
jgi:hypothetical protein